MLEQILGYILYFLGLRSLNTPPTVRGDSTVSASLSTSSATLSTVSSEFLQKKVRERKINWNKKMNRADLKKQFEEMMKTRRSEADKQMKELRAKLKADLAKIKDAKKRTLAEMLATELPKINTKRTDAWKTQLNQMTDTLKKMEEKGAATGKNTTALTTAIKNAEQTIAGAMNAVIAQSGKLYTITITNGEASMSANVQTSLKTLQNDLKPVEDTVKTARESVRLAIRELAKLTGESMESEDSETKPRITGKITGTPAVSLHETSGD